MDGATIAPSETSDFSQIAGRGFAAVLLDIEAQLLALAQGAQTRTIDSGDVNKHIFGAVFRLDEAIALLGIEPFHCSVEIFFPLGAKVAALQLSGRAKRWKGIKSSRARREERGTRSTP